MIVVELDTKVREIVDEFPGETFSQFFRRDAEFTRREHDRSAVSIGCTDINAVMTAEFLESDPDIGLDVLDEMAHVRRAIGVRQGARNENFSR